MAASTATNIGLQYAWALGEDGWNTGMDSNLLKLDSLVQPNVIDSTINTPPGSPTTGDKYVVATGGSGDWSGLDAKFVIWSGSAWVSYTAKEGWIVYDQTNNYYLKFNGSAWAQDPFGDRAYAESLVTGLWNDRGNFDASVNAYPSSGGSGTAGAIMKGDIWTISVAGTLPTAQSVEAGDTVRALVDAPGNTQANWAIAQSNIGYVPESSANKSTDGTMADNSATKYPSQSAVVTYVGNQLLSYGSVESQTYHWFEDFIALGETETQKLTNLRCRNDRMNVISPASLFTNAGISGADHAMGWGQIYNDSLSTGLVGCIQNYDGYSKIPVTASKELVFAGSLDTLPTNTTTTDCVHRIGMCGYGVGGNADPVGQSLASAYFQADKDGFWKCFSGKTGANQNTTTGVATAEDTYISLRIVIVATTGVVYFYINGTLVATHDAAGVVPYEQGWFRFIALYNQGAGTFPSSGGVGGRGNLFIDAWGQLIKAGADRANLRFLT